MENSFADRRRQTRSSVYHCLYEAEGFCTRQTLAQSLGLSLPTIYQNLTELVDSGLVRYAGAEHRRPQGPGRRNCSGRPLCRGRERDGPPAALLGGGFAPE